MDRPIRILHIQGRMGLGGAETFLMNSYRNIDRDKYQFDFVIYEEFRDVDVYYDEIKRLGGRLFFVPNPNKHIIAYARALRRIIREEDIAIVHNQVYFGGGLNLMIAKSAKKIIGINHSHATQSGKGLIKKLLEPIFRFLNKRYSDYNFACSFEAGKSLFHQQKFEVINNGIDLEAYIEAKPLDLEPYGIPKGAIVVSHIGRFEAQKNHHFLVEILHKAITENKNVYALLVGEGSLFAEVQKQVQDLSIENHVIFLKLRRDINNILKSASLFLLPSLYEGLPIVAVESQASGQYLLLADTITQEVDLTGNVTFLPIDQGPDVWAQAILHAPHNSLSNKDIKDKMHSYDMSVVAKRLESVYDVLSRSEE